MNRMEQNFGRVLITSAFDLKENFSKVQVKNKEDYLKELEKNPKGFCEFVGLQEFQVKPYFDLDPKGEDFDYSLFDEFEADLKKVCNQDVYKAGRDARIEKDVLKHSRRFYLKARITYSNIPIVFKDLFEKYKGIIDAGIYDPNRRLHAPLSKFKRELKVPKLKVLSGDLFDCCATYILEDYENLDLRISKEQIKFNNTIDFMKKILETNEKDIYEERYEDEKDCDLNFTEVMIKLSKERASNFDDWKNIGICLINLSHRKIISRGQLYELFDLFSSNADNYDSNGVLKFLDYNITRFNGKGYGIKYLLDCLKIDDEDYYKKITHKDMIINASNDDIGASELVVKHYKDILIICKGILYVKYNDVWICSANQVDKILIDMIGKLDIIFFGADGKRRYHYNKSIKHIKDCVICIKANQTIINDKFYDDMIKNNKYYLPFKNGIYSFKDKKLFKYDELPNIHFTYKIPRDFPRFVENDYEELMNRIIIPIYPNEEEQLFNAHIKARALAGLYEDKKWYGYSGSRNSGKGTETGLLKSAFGEFVLDFNAKCLIFNKFGNPEPAKALSWVVDKKDARIIISNEIDVGDETLKLNGAFIKSLASGGDTMDGRRLYENSISFIPQFTMFLCYNKFCEIYPEDAKENLEQFEYKSKFVEKDELIPNVPFLKLKDDNIKEFIKEERIIDAYILYILNAFSNPRMKTPISIKNSTEINNGEEIINVETFILENFKTTNNKKDRLHTETINSILIENGYKLNIIEVGRLMNRFQIGKYNSQCNIDKIRKIGFEYIEYSGKNKSEILNL